MNDTPATSRKVEPPPLNPLPRVIVTGSRTWDDPAAVRIALTRAWRDAGQPILVVHGACRARRLACGAWDWTTMSGADRHADDWAVEHAFAGIQVERHPADWRDGRAAGPIRNSRMIMMGAWRVLAFPSLTGPSYGTRDCIEQAEAAGLDVRFPAHDYDRTRLARHGAPGDNEETRCDCT